MVGHANRITGGYFPSLPSDVRMTDEGQRIDREQTKNAEYGESRVKRWQLGGQRDERRDDE
jgi:hypothetical protein